MPVSAITRDGRSWTPLYLEAIDQARCIGCGRCFKVCDRGVMTLQGVSEDGEVVDLDDDDVERKVMILVDGGNCVGCAACAKVCPSNCQTHAAA